MWAIIEEDGCTVDETTPRQKLLGRNPVTEHLFLLSPEIRGQITDKFAVKDVHFWTNLATTLYAGRAASIFIKPLNSKVLQIKIGRPDRPGRSDL
jgi:hypothetical protein